MNPKPLPPLTPDEFTERVMASLETTSVPTPTRTFLSAIRTGAAHDAGAALWVAWHLVTVRSWHIEPRVRARSFALVLAVVSVLGTSSLAAAAAVQVVVPHWIERAPTATPRPPVVEQQGPATDGGARSDDPGAAKKRSPVPSTAPKPAKPDTGPKSPIRPKSNNRVGGSGAGDRSGHDGSEDAHDRERGSGGGDEPKDDGDTGGSGG